MLFRNPFHRLQPMKRPGGDDSDTISRVEDLITSAFDVFAADLERFLVLAGVAKPGVPPNPSTVNRLTGPAVALTDAAGILRVDPAHFFYIPSPGSNTPAVLLVGAGPPGATQGVVAEIHAKVGGTLAGLTVTGETGGNPLTGDQPMLVLANDGGGVTGILFQFGSRITTCGITTGIDGSMQISAPDFGSAGAGFGGLSIYADLAKGTRIARFDPHGTHGSVTVDSLTGVANGALTADASGKLQKVPTLTIVDDPTDSAVRVTATSGRALELGAGGVDDWLSVGETGVVTASELGGVGSALTKVDSAGVFSRAALPASFRIPVLQLQYVYNAESFTAPGQLIFLAPATADARFVVESGDGTVNSFVTMGDASDYLTVGVHATTNQRTSGDTGIVFTVLDNGTAVTSFTYSGLGVSTPVANTISVLSGGGISSIPVGHEVALTMETDTAIVGSILITVMVTLWKTVSI